MQMDHTSQNFNLPTQTQNIAVNPVYISHYEIGDTDQHGLKTPVASFPETHPNCHTPVLPTLGISSTTPTPS